MTVLSLTPNGDYWRITQFDPNGLDLGAGANVAFADINGDLRPELVAWVPAVLDSLVPAPVVTPISIVPAAPAGETAVMEVGEFTVNEAAGAVPKRTAVAPVKPDPVTATAVPPVSDPLAGAMPATTGPLEVA